MATKFKTDCASIYSRKTCNKRRSAQGQRRDCVYEDGTCKDREIIPGTSFPQSALQGPSRLALQHVSSMYPTQKTIPFGDPSFSAGPFPGSMASGSSSPSQLKKQQSTWDFDSTIQPTAKSKSGGSQAVQRRRRQQGRTKINSQSSPRQKPGSQSNQATTWNLGNGQSGQQMSRQQGRTKTAANRQSSPRQQRGSQSNQASPWDFDSTIQRTPQSNSKSQYSPQSKQRRVRQQSPSNSSPGQKPSSQSNQATRQNLGNGQSGQQRSRQQARTKTAANRQSSARQRRGSQSNQTSPWDFDSTIQPTPQSNSKSQHSPQSKQQRGIQQTRSKSTSSSPQQTASSSPRQQRGSHSDQAFSWDYDSTVQPTSQSKSQGKEQQAVAQYNYGSQNKRQRTPTLWDTIGSGDNAKSNSPSPFAQQGGSSRQSMQSPFAQQGGSSRQSMQSMQSMQSPFAQQGGSSRQSMQSPFTQQGGSGRQKKPSQSSQGTAQSQVQGRSGGSRSQQPQIQHAKSNSSQSRQRRQSGRSAQASIPSPFASSQSQQAQEENDVANTLRYLSETRDISKATQDYVRGYDARRQSFIDSFSIAGVKNKVKEGFEEYYDKMSTIKSNRSLKNKQLGSFVRLHAKFKDPETSYDTRALIEQSRPYVYCRTADKFKRWLLKPQIQAASSLDSDSYAREARHLVESVSVPLSSAGTKKSSHAGKVQYAKGVLKLHAMQESM